MRILEAKEAVSPIDYIKNSLRIKKLIFHIIYFFAGLFISDSTIFLKYSPFGVSYIAVVPMKYIITSAIGTSFGYIFLSPSTGSYRYICSLIAVAAIRYTLSDIKKINKSRMYAPLLAFVPLFTTSVVLRLSGNINSYNTVISIAESLLAAAGAYFFYRSCEILNRGSGISSLNSAEISCVIISAGALMLSLTSLTIREISVGRVIACVLIMLSAYYGKAVGGCIVGTCTGLVFSLSSPIYGYLSGAYAFSGLICGVFSYGHKIFTAVSFAVLCFIMSFQSSMSDIIAVTAYETIISAVIFMLIPQRVGVFFKELFPVPKTGESAQGLRRAILMRLDFASKALADVSCSVDNVSKRLEKLDSNNITAVCDKTADAVCKHCGMKNYCWDKFMDETKNDFLCSISPLEEKGAITVSDLPESFYKRCIKRDNIVDELNYYYEQYLMCMTARNRLNEVRSVVSGQFSGLSEILREMHSEYRNYESFNTDVAEKIAERLKSLGINPINVSCRIDKFGRMNIEIEASYQDKFLIKRAVLLKEISHACGRRLDSPSITDAPGICRLQFSELPFYDVEIASAQHICNDGQLCGDSVTFFNDGSGRIFGIIGDGMGTGPRAAVDGGMATGIMSRLIRAGLGFNCSLRTVNSALLVKSGDESLSTLDMICIDLFSGETTFIKAGGCTSYVCRGGRLAKIELDSLPLGILPEIHTGEKKVTLMEDDIVVMVSDGAVSCGELWLESLLKCWDDRSAQELADAIVSQATAHRTDGHDDDITALVLRMASSEGTSAMSA